MTFDLICSKYNTYTELVARETRRVELVEQEQLTLPGITFFVKFVLLDL